MWESKIRDQRQKMAGKKLEADGCEPRNTGNGNFLTPKITKNAEADGFVSFMDKSVGELYPEPMTHLDTKPHHREK
jgi:hypothetical protein